MRRRGFTLIEVLAAIAMIGVTISLIFPLCNAIFVEMPKAQRVFNANSQLVSAMDALARDMDDATALPDSAGGLAARPNRILLEKTDALILYSVEEGKITRRQYDSAGNPAGKPQSWPAPGVKMDSIKWLKAGRAYAIEVETCIVMTTNGINARKFVNSHVFFLAGGPAGGGK